MSVGAQKTNKMARSRENGLETSFSNQDIVRNDQSEERVPKPLTELLPNLFNNL